jgi:hypothetical protein
VGKKNHCNFYYRKVEAIQEYKIVQGLKKERKKKTKERKKERKRKKEKKLDYTIKREFSQALKAASHFCFIL